jgi:hypothetical protein
LLLFGAGAVEISSRDSQPFAELKVCSHIDDRGKAADKDPAFSKRIRDGSPCMEKQPAW